MDFSKAVDRGKGLGVVIAEHPPTGGQDLRVQLIGTLEVAEGTESLGEVVHRLQGVGMIVA